jgi:hypothetical protein
MAHPSSASESQTGKGVGAKSGPAQRPASLDPAALGFEPQGMVSWSDPWQLIQIAVKSLLSGLFGSYADKREMLAVLDCEPIYKHCSDRDEQGDLWIDFVADTGDGFDSTYTIASLAAMPVLEVAAANRGEAGRAAAGNPSLSLPRGRVFVFGGDEVYPTASRVEYQNRLLGPYQSALPWSKHEATAPTMYAIPGNHDWYDGLTAFLRTFGQKRWLGGWKTEQSRSYFALQLADHWWLWGTDIQLESDVDIPQIEFFKKVAKEMTKGDHVILCTAEPSWSHQWLGKPNAFATLGFFEQTLIREFGHKLALVLSGDLHNYHRYSREDESLQRITAGGGGAFLHATHFLPDGVRPEGKPVVPELSEGDSGASGATRYRFDKAFPSQKESQGIARSARWALFKSKCGPAEKFFHMAHLVRSYGFAAVMSAYFLVFAWVLQSASLQADGTLLQALDRRMDALGIGGTLGLGFCQVWVLLTGKPAALAFALILPACLIAFCGAKGWKRVCLGTCHALMHFVTFFILFLGFAVLDHHLGVPVGMTLDGVSAVHPAFILLFTLELAICGFLVAGFTFGNYLIWFQKCHREEVFSFQSIDDWKNFLKLRIDNRDRLWVYPLGVRKVCRAWKANPGGGAEDPLIVPQAGKLAERVELIEKPLCYDPAVGKWSQP